MTASAAAGLPVLTFVVPCYNEEEVLGETSRRLLALLDELKGQVAAGSSIVFVDDGSKDATWSLIEEFRTGDARVHGIKLARNFGHQHALLAGLMTAPGDIIISLDADLQDDLTVIPRMVEEYAKGAQIVYGVRYQRDTDTWFKRTSARLYYRILRYFGVQIVPDHADFRLMSRRALETPRDFHEVNLFLRGIVPLLGFKTAIVKYQRLERFAGVTKYPFSRMLALAIDGITSFSAVPLQWITRIGFILALLSVLFGFWALVVGIYSPNRVTGWASIVTPIFFLGGLQLLATGVIGNYIAKIYLETKRRPRFIIETSI